MTQNIIVDAVSKAIDGLDDGFIWHSSPQGVSYWKNVRDALEAIRNEAQQSNIREEIAALRRRIDELEAKL